MLNGYTTLKASPIRSGTGVIVRYRMLFNPESNAYSVHVEQRFDNGGSCSGRTNADALQGFPFVLVRYFLSGIFHCGQ